MVEQASTPLADAERAGWRDRLLVPTLVAVGLVMAMLSSLGAPLVPAIAQANHVSLSTGQWVLTATLLAGAIASPIMGQLGDGKHRRQVILWALAIVLTGSVLAAAFDGFAILIVGRSMMGVGLGLIPVAMAIARRHLPNHRSPAVIGILSITAATGIGIGYPVTGLIAESFDYHVAFWFGAAVVAVALGLAFLVLPTDHESPSSRLDLIGAILFSIVLASLLTALSEGGHWGWGSTSTVGLIALAAVLLAVWIRYELRARRPLVVLRQFRSRTVLVSNVIGAIVSVALYLFMPIVVEFVQISRSEGYGFGVSVAVAGLCLVPMSIGTALASPVVLWIRKRYGGRTTLVISQLLFVAAMLFFALRHDALWEAFVTMGVGGLAVGMSFGVMPGFIISSVAPDAVGSAMGLYQVIRSTGSAVGSAISGSILAAYTIANHDVPSVTAYEVIMFIAAGLCLLLIPVISLFPAPSRASSGLSAGVDLWARESGAQTPAAAPMRS